MKSWADHSSSDEDSDNEIEPNLSADLALKTTSIDTDLSYDNTTDGILSPDNADDGLEYPPEPPPVDFGVIPPTAPNCAPFTAHIGNLSFGVKEGPDLANEIEKLVTDRYNGEESVTVTEARVGVDRETGKRRGYGYVEFATLEELLILLNLNDGFSLVSGRMIRIDVATPRRDRQPMHSRQSNNYQNDDGNRPPRSSSRSRGQSNYAGDIDGNQFRGGVRRAVAPNSAGASGNTGGVSKRPTLKLAPRSKPLEGAVSSGLSNIFGGARPREEVVRSRQQQTGGSDRPALDTKKASIGRGEETSAGRGGIQPRHNSGGSGQIPGGGRGGRGGRVGRGGRGGRGGRKSSLGRGDITGSVRGDASSYGTGDASGYGKGDTSSHCTGDASGRSGQGGVGKTNKGGQPRTRPASAGGNAWNKSTTSSSKTTAPPTPPMEVLVPNKKPVTKVTNAFALLDVDSESD